MARRAAPATPAWCRAGSAPVGRLEPQFAAELPGPAGQVAQPAAPALGRDADPVVGHPHGQHPVGAHVHGHVHLAGLRVPGRVGQRLAQRGERLLGRLGPDAGAEAGAEPQRRGEAEHVGHLLDQGDDVAAQVRPGRGVPGLQREDGGADVLDGLVHRVDRVGDPAGHLRPGDHRHGALQRHAGGVQPLDDQVVQVTRDPVAVLVQRQPLGLGPARGQLERDARLGGERGHDVRLGLRERRPPVTAPDGEHAADVARRAEREHDRGPDVAHRAAGGLGGPLVVGEVGRCHRLARGQHPPGQGLAGRQHQAADRVCAVALGVGDRQPPALLAGQREHGEVGAGEFARLPGDARQYLGRARNRTAAGW